MDEFSSGREIASTLGNVLLSLNEAGYEVRRVAPSSIAPTLHQLFDELVTSDSLKQSSASLFADGYYARAVEEAFKCLNNAVKDKSGTTDRDGNSLMRAVFSPNAPILKLNPLQSPSQRDEQQGYMDLFAGAMTGIRNPRAHEHSLADAGEVALELLVLANHLMRKLDGAVESQPQSPA